MKRGSLVLLGILVVVMLFISGCGGVTITCSEGETRCSSSHDSIIQCSGGNWEVIQNCADLNPVCKVVSGAPQCTTNSAPVVNAGNDFSVSGNTGTLVNFDFASDFSGWVSTEPWVTAKIGDAVVFDGYDDYIKVLDSASLNFKDKVTISAWVNLDWTGNMWDLIAMKEGTGERAFGMWVNEDTNEILLSYKGEDLKYYNLKVPGFNYMEWNHIVGVIDTVNNYMEIYINNVRYSSTGTTDLPSIKLNNLPVYIGGDVNGYYSTSGVFDEIAILNDALTADEINQAYQSYQSGIRPGLDIERLQLYYALDEGAGTTAVDSSNSIGKTITLSGSATDSDNDVLGYRWSVVSAPVTNFEYGDQKTLNPWFVPTQSGVYTFRLNVNDGVITTSDDISITVGDGVTICSDGTLYGLCSASKPLFCDKGNLINNCQSCGCDSGQTCQTDGSCLSTTCSDGTRYNGCSTTRPLLCDNNGNLIDYCQVCGCSAGQTCQTDNSCLPITCSDGTLALSCSTNKPLFCDVNGNLINDCQNCGCDPGLFCRGDDSSCTMDKCITLVNNGDPATKLDILYIGDGYSQSQLSTFANDVNEFKNKLLEYEPFTSQRNKINFYRIDNTNYLGCTNDYKMICDITKINEETVYCPHDQVIVIVNMISPIKGRAYLDTGPSVASRYYSTTGVHEFGHSFGGLYDEYTFGETSGGAIAIRANCASESTCSKWSDLMGVEGVGCFQECKYVDWYKPLQSGSIMLDSDGGGDFNPVGERELKRKMEAYS